MTLTRLPRFLPHPDIVRGSARKEPRHVDVCLETISSAVSPHPDIVNGSARRGLRQNSFQQASNQLYVQGLKIPQCLGIILQFTPLSRGMRSSTAQCRPLPKQMLVEDMPVAASVRRITPRSHRSRSPSCGTHSGSPQVWYRNGGG